MVLLQQHVSMHARDVLHGQEGRGIAWKRD